LSVEYIALAFVKSKAEATSKFVLVTLANFADENGYCYPSVRKLMQYTCLSDRAVQQSISNLIELGEVEKVREGGQFNGKNVSNTYQILLGRGEPHSPPGGNDVHQGGEPHSPRGVNHVRSIRHIEPSLEPSITYTNGSAGDEKKRKYKAKAESYEELRGYVLEKLGLQNDDAIWLYAKWQGNDWKVNNRPMASWKMTAQSWKAAGYFPSQKGSAYQR
jgi:hypothetical protein